MISFIWGPGWVPVSLVVMTRKKKNELHLNYEVIIRYFLLVPEGKIMCDDSGGKMEWVHFFLLTSIFCKS